MRGLALGQKVLPSGASLTLQSQFQDRQMIPIIFLKTLTAFPFCAHFEQGDKKCYPEIKGGKCSSAATITANLNYAKYTRLVISQEQKLLLQFEAFKLKDSQQHALTALQ